MKRAFALLADEASLRLELLNTPIASLGLSLRASPLLARSLRWLRRDLRRSGIRLHPHFYLSDEYGCVEGTANIGIAFWDASEPLRRLVKSLRGDWNTADDVMWLLRHETGHAFCYSYKLYQDREFRRLFRVKGHFFHTYPEHDRYLHRCNPWSRDFVNPSGDHYAQKHPDDDFAETFAVWLDPHSHWRMTYAHKPGALRKLEYVNRVVADRGRAEPEVPSDRRALHLPVDEMTATVGEFLRASGRQFQRQAQTFFDRDLEEIFAARPRRRNGAHSAAEFIIDHGRLVVDRVVHWTGEREEVVRALLKKVKRRVETLDLVVPRKLREEALVELTSYITTLTMNYAHRSRFTVE
ncbi:MAG: hypothetical protein HYY93_05830 [Planctomycetes bacterium]|nr:hypothetical protein [Planctomycetota bacterium]